ncbi:MAG: hypothetical protein ABW215_22260 [Kibdelosporangium sp.]
MAPTNAEPSSRATPAAEVILSRPGPGPIPGAPVLVGVGDDPPRYADARARKSANYAGKPGAVSRSRGNDSAAVVLDRSADHRDEHVVKFAATAVSPPPRFRRHRSFADTAVESFERTGDDDALAAAHLAADLIPAA